MNDILIIIITGFVTGISTVLFGFGGGFIVVPFVYHIETVRQASAGNSMHIAVATSTAVMVFNAGWASFQSWRTGKFAPGTLFPLAGFIAIGSVAGSVLSGFIADTVIRNLFIIYLMITLADCLIRRGFVNRPTARKLSDSTLRLGGVFIGVVATLLGVGGSVMTVPLLRRHGYEMRHCVSAANPLSLPVALCGTVTYSLSGSHLLSSGSYLGFINLKILMLLTVAGFIGMLFTRRYIPAIPDILHARIYVILLFIVLVAITF